jgi:mono/diheme cytochrome c family protein
MLKSLLVAAMAGIAVAGISFADQSSQSKVVIPVGKTAANDGRQMYASYCAPCHGTDGRGNGPAATALKNQPTDLTALTRNNHGKYPDSHVYEVIQFGSDIPAHGSAQMPVWGKILGNINRANPQEKELRMSNLTAYIKSIQAQ